MIFVTVGTILPFDRLIAAVDAWAGATGRGDLLFGQLCRLGPDNHRPAHFEWAEELTPMEFRARVEAADAIVAHAGIGTIVDALTRSKPLLIMPRRHALREHVNDHQLETVAKFAGREGLLTAMKAEQVGPALDVLAAGAGTPPRLGPDADESLIAAVRQAVLGMR